jgi:hypothetical protein
MAENQWACGALCNLACNKSTTRACAGKRFEHAPPASSLTTSGRCQGPASSPPFRVIYPLSQVEGTQEASLFHLALRGNVFSS